VYVRVVTRLAVAAVAVLALAACGGEPEPPPPPAAAPAPESTTAETTTEEATTEEATSGETTTEAAPPPPKPEPPPGVPAFVAGYRGWTKLNAAPIPPRDSDPHLGTKNVYASRDLLANGRFPVGTVVVKEATRPGADFIGLIAIMRKQRGADPEHNDWVFVEFTRESANARFGEQAAGAVCWSCHVGARESDYVFTE
jgi:Cytochrome P460